MLYGVPSWAQDFFSRGFGLFLCEQGFVVIDTLLNLYQKGSLPPSQLWSGKKNNLITDALGFAGQILKNSTGFSLEKNLAHPNFRLLECIEGKREIAVDQVREMLPFLKNTPMLPGYRVLVVNGADILNRQAANALLKMVEEPPHKTVIIMLCSSIGRVLPTLISRCARFSFSMETSENNSLAPELNQFFGKGIIAALNKNYVQLEGLIASLKDVEMEEALASVHSFSHRILRAPVDVDTTPGIKKLLEIKPHSFWTEGALLSQRYLLASRQAHLPVKDILYGIFLLLADPSVGYSIGVDGI